MNVHLAIDLLQKPSLKEREELTNLENDQVVFLNEKVEIVAVYYYIKKKRWLI